ncbi:uncharacterized protein LOC123018505 [Varanus komodoensis]|uniref:uncharacterized protein LOC123018505 n=1 Tax=Varanus komodoensis TaxID=61221 RepID=UPI001CF7E392|nr:uncharacterized protein LOC123018505 [Varanus komodoensis]
MKCMAPVCAYLQLRGIQIYPYLNDWLLVSWTREGLSSAVNMTCNLLQDLGLCINHQKSSPYTDDQLYWSPTGFYGGKGLPPSKQTTCYRSTHLPNSTRRNCSCPICSKTVGTYGSVHHRSPTCQTPAASPPIVLQREVLTTKGSAYEADSTPVLCSSVSIMVDRVKQPKHRSPVLASVSDSDSRYRRIPSGMGSLVLRSTHPGGLELSGLQEPYQLSGTSLCVQSTTVIQGRASPAGCPGNLGQHSHSFLLKQTRGDKVPKISSFVDANLGVVHTERHHSYCSTSRGHRQCESRSLEQTYVTVT